MTCHCCGEETTHPLLDADLGEVCGGCLGELTPVGIMLASPALWLRPEQHQEEQK